MKVFLRKFLLSAVFAAILTGFSTCYAAGGKMPVLMYHDLTNDPAKTNSMTITGERFRLDMEFLKEFGYTPLLPADLIAIRQGAMELPEKPVMITFDDGYRSNYDIAYPVLQQTGMKATIAVVAHNMAAEDTADPVRTHLLWSEMREMVESGLVEIGSHTYNLHNPQHKGNSAPDGIDGVMRLSGESKAAYRTRVGTDLVTSIELIRQNTGQAQVNYFSYPFGAYDSWMQPLLEENGIAVSTLTNAGLADPKGSLYNLPRYGIKMETPVSRLLQQTDTAVPALATVSVNGVQSKLPAYNINGSNYVRVRDVAVLLKDTPSHFDVQWNNAQCRVELASFTPYTPIGTENKPLPEGERTVKSVTEPTVVDTVPNMVAAYQLDGYTYYKLRSLGDLCGFYVDWNNETHVVEVTA
nr:polysaccharide deacetylase family protein [uncultured Agathobaculum sp.]